MKRFFIELLISLGYAVLLAFGASCFLVVTAHGGDGYHFNYIVGNILMVLGSLSFIGTIVFAVWDWDRDEIENVLQRVLCIAMRIATVIICFYPLLLLCSYLLLCL